MNRLSSIVIKTIGIFFTVGFLISGAPSAEPEIIERKEVQKPSAFNLPSFDEWKENLETYIFQIPHAQATSVVIDSTVNIDQNSHNGTTFTVAFTDDQTGYAFYRDSDGSCAYRKTVDGGTTWATTTVTIDTQTDCLRVAIWYDQWTPGNTTGTNIHVLTIDSGQDDLFYTKLNTANDTVSSTLNITGANQGGTFATGANIQSITMATNGTLYAGVQDGADSFVIRCSANCSTTTTNWTEAGTSPFDLANDWLGLMPLTNGDILAIRLDLSQNDIDSRRFFNSSSSWDGGWTDIDTACTENGAYDGHFGVSINNTTQDIFMVFACSLGTIGADDDIRSSIYRVASSSWSIQSDAITDATSTGITGAKVGLDDNTGNIYAVYSLRSVSSTVSSAHVYYKISTSSMASWGPQQGPVSQTSTDIYGLRIDGINDDRLYATWVDANDDSINGNTIVDLVPTSYEQSAYRLFTNQNATSVGTAYAGNNASATVAADGTPFRLRMLLHVGGEGVDVGRENYKLQFASSTNGGCDTAFSGETYVDVTTSTGDIRFYDNSSSSDGVALSSNASDPVHGGDTIVNQTYEEANPFTNSVAKIFGGQDGKWDFALYAATSTALNVYCFRIIRENGDTLLNTYSVIPEIHINATPTVGAIIINGGQDISLTSGTSTIIQTTSTVTDANGSDDFAAVIGKLYRSGVGENCTVDDNNCYRQLSCARTNCSGNNCLATCDFRVRFHADPTDTDTPWSVEDWRASMQAIDARSASSTATSSVGVEMLSLVGFDVDSTISYGSLSPGSTTNPFATTTVTSTGNVSLDVTVYGTNMIRSAFSIPVGNQRYATSTISFASSTALLVNPGALVNLNMFKSLASTTPATSSLYWGIQVPSPQEVGTYTGTNTFIGAKNTLPWP